MGDELEGASRIHPHPIGWRVAPTVDRAKRRYDDARLCDFCKYPNNEWVWAKVVSLNACNVDKSKGSASRTTKGTYLGNNRDSRQEHPQSTQPVPFPSSQTDFLLSRQYRPSPNHPLFPSYLSYSYLLPFAPPTRRTSWYPPLLPWRLPLLTRVSRRA
jgi:hypothetical protein